MVPAEHLPDQYRGTTAAVFTIFASIVEDGLRCMDIQEQTVLGCSRGRRSVSRTTGKICLELLLRFCIIERGYLAGDQCCDKLASNKAPGRTCLRANSALTAILHLCVAAFWCYWSSEPKIANWRLCVSDIREVIRLARLL